MGIMDHRKQWDFIVAAPAMDCIAAFEGAMSSKSAISMRKANWSVSRDNDGAIATYEGRGGLAKAATLFSERGSNVEEIAIGSQLEFQITKVDESRTWCSLWFSSRGTAMGMTADASFFRGYMKAVANKLRALDSSLTLQKN